MQEIWKDIKDYEGLYQVSNLGRVKRIKNKIHILKTIDDGKGYKKARLCKNGILKSYRIHRLVAEAFIPNPFNYSEVNHKDFNRSNNLINNLEWCNKEYNMKHSVKANRFHNKPVICENNNLITIFNSINEASFKTGINRNNIGRCCNSKRKTAGGYKWRFLKGEI